MGVSLPLMVRRGLLGKGSSGRLSKTCKNKIPIIVSFGK